MTKTQGNAVVGLLFIILVLLIIFLVGQEAIMWTTGAVAFVGGAVFTWKGIE